MPRARGQIDEHKSDAILAAAVELFSTKGPATTMADIARAAGVSKQTLYNRYPNKSELARTLLSQRSLAITSPLGNDGPLEEALEGVAKGLIERVLDPHSSDHLRAMAMSSHDDPELARAVFEAGPKQSLSRIADWLSRQHEAGRLSVPNPAEAPRSLSAWFWATANSGFCWAFHLSSTSPWPMRVRPPAALSRLMRPERERFGLYARISLNPYAKKLATAASPAEPIHADPSFVLA